MPSSGSSRIHRDDAWSPRSSGCGSPRIQSVRAPTKEASSIKQARWQKRKKREITSARRCASSRSANKRDDLHRAASTSLWCRRGRATSLRRRHDATKGKPRSGCIQRRPAKPNANRAHVYNGGAAAARSSLIRAREESIAKVCGERPRPKGAVFIRDHWRRITKKKGIAPQQRRRWWWCQRKEALDVCSGT